MHGTCRIFVLPAHLVRTVGGAYIEGPFIPGVIHLRSVDVQILRHTVGRPEPMLLKIQEFATFEADQVSPAPAEFLHMRADGNLLPCGLGPPVGIQCAGYRVGEEERVGADAQGQVDIVPPPKGIGELRSPVRSAAGSVKRDFVKMVFCARIDQGVP